MSARKNQKARTFPWPCSECCTLTVVPTVVDYTAKVKQDGVLHELHLPAVEIPRCQTCGNLTITTEVDEKVNDALRAHLRLLTPAQLRKNIEALGLKQQELAERLGVAPETISRWVNGALIQSRAMDNLLRLYFALPEVREVLRGAHQDPTLGVDASLSSHREPSPSVNESCPEPIARRMQTRQFAYAEKKYGIEWLRSEVAVYQTLGSLLPIGDE